MAPSASATDLLRNDALRVRAPRTPALVSVFTGASSGCSLDPSVSLDTADPGDCGSRVPGEGPSPELNGSSDSDDLYVLDFDLSGIGVEPETDLLSSDARPLVFWQFDGACLANSLRILKYSVSDSVRFVEDCVASEPVGACCAYNGLCEDAVTRSVCEGRSDYFQGHGVLCSDEPCPTGKCCTPGLCEVDVVEAYCFGSWYSLDVCTPDNCCFPGGFCGLADPMCCSADGGTRVAICDVVSCPP